MTLPTEFHLPELTPAGRGDGAAGGEATAHAVPEDSKHDITRYRLTGGRVA